MKNITKWMLAAAMAIGGLGLTAAPAKAAQIGVYVGSGAEYVPPYPGPGYVWIAGYYSDGYWIPGRWAFNGVVRDRDDFYRGRVYFDRDDFYRGRVYFDRDDFYHGRDHFDRDDFFHGRDHFDRDRRDHRDRDRDHDRRDFRGDRR